MRACAGRATVQRAAVAVIAAIAMFVSKSSPVASEAHMKPKILKIKEKLWQHPSDWQRNANKLKKY